MVGYMFRIESIHHQAIIQNKQQVPYNVLTVNIQHFRCVVFCGIAHHIYHYNKAVTVKVSLLRLKRFNLLNRI